MDRKKQTDAKIEAASAKPVTARDDEVVLVIVKVKEANYVPGGFKVRSRIDDEMFTAECAGADLRAAQSDPKVESIALTKRLRVGR